MDRNGFGNSDVLLARVNRELERISEEQHRLARRKALLQEQATKLRLGASPFEVRFTLRAAMIEQEHRDQLMTAWTEESQEESVAAATR
jgi:hypothetical protein